MLSAHYNNISGLFYKPQRSTFNFSKPQINNAIKLFLLIQLFIFMMVI